MKTFTNLARTSGCSFGSAVSAPGQGRKVRHEGEQGEIKMKYLMIGVALAGLAAIAPLSAQERRDDGGSSRNGRDCTSSQTTNTIGDVIFGRNRNNTANCGDNRSSRANGSWYPVGRDNRGGTIYERRTTDSNGNLIIQRARRDANGNLSVISTRNAGNNGIFDRRRNRDGNNNGENERGDRREGNRGRHGRGDDNEDRQMSRGNGGIFGNINSDGEHESGEDHERD